MVGVALHYLLIHILPVIVLGYLGCLAMEFLAVFDDKKGLLMQALSTLPIIVLIMIALVAATRAIPHDGGVVPLIVYAGLFTLSTFFFYRRYLTILSINIILTFAFIVILKVN